MDKSSSMNGDVILDIMAGAWKSQCLYVVAKLKIADLVELGFSSDEGLSNATNVTIDHVHRLMSYLVAEEIFILGEKGLYENTPTSSLLRENGEESLHELVLMLGEQVYKSWSHLHQSLITGIPGFEVEYKAKFYDYLDAHEDLSLRFQNLLKSRVDIFSPIPSLLDLSNVTFVDIGGGGGQLTRAILDVEPAAKCVVLDLPAGLTEAKKHLADLVAKEKVTLCEGDMFSQLPKNLDYYFLSRILGDLDDSGAVKLLRNCRKFMGTHSKVAIIEQIVPEGESSAMPLLWDIHLMIMVGGRQRTFNDFYKLLSDAELQIDAVFDLPLHLNLLTIKIADQGMSAKSEPDV